MISMHINSRTEWSDKEKLEKEQEVIGCYLSAHPLESYRKYLGCFKLSSFEQALEQITHSYH